MTTIRARCSVCGDVDMPAHDVWLFDNGKQYGFTCPGCNEGRVKKADKRIHTLLRASGVLYIEEIVADETGDLRSEA